MQHFSKQIGLLFASFSETCAKTKANVHFSIPHFFSSLCCTHAGRGRHSLLEEDKRKKGKWRKIKMSGRERKERWKKKKNNKAEEEEKRKKGENRDEKNRVIDGKA